MSVMATSEEKVPSEVVVAVMLAALVKIWRVLPRSPEVADIFKVSVEMSEAAPLPSTPPEVTLMVTDVGAVIVPLISTSPAPVEIATVEPALSGPAALMVTVPPVVVTVAEVPADEAALNVMLPLVELNEVEPPAVVVPANVITPLVVLIAISPPAFMSPAAFEVMVAPVLAALKVTSPVALIAAFTAMLSLLPVVFISTSPALRAWAMVKGAADCSLKVSPAPLEDAFNVTPVVLVSLTYELPPVLARKVAALVEKRVPLEPMSPVPEVKLRVAVATAPAVCEILPLPLAFSVTVVALPPPTP